MDSKERARNVWVLQDLAQELPQEPYEQEQRDLMTTHCRPCFARSAVTLLRVQSKKR